MQALSHKLVTMGVCLALLASIVAGCAPAREVARPVGETSEAVLTPVGNVIKNNPTTVVGATAGVVVGALVGGPIGAAVGGVVGGLAGGWVDNEVLPPSPGESRATD